MFLVLGSVSQKFVLGIGCGCHGVELPFLPVLVTKLHRVLYRVVESPMGGLMIGRMLEHFVPIWHLRRLIQVVDFVFL